MIGTTFVPIILGSDKQLSLLELATMSITHSICPLGMSTIMSGVHTRMQSLSLAFLQCQRVSELALSHIIQFTDGLVATKEHVNDVCFRKFCHQLFHSSLSKILKRLRPGMTKLEVVKFSDRHFCHVVYGLGPYIADYEEQVLLMCIVPFWCPQ
jgi:hypothetical protein